MNLCQYKDVFGKPGEGVHKYRVLDIAIVDTVLTLFLALLLAKLLKLNNFGGILIAFSLGIILHKIFCVETTLNKILNI